MILVHHTEHLKTLLEKSLQGPHNLLSVWERNCSCVYSRVVCVIPLVTLLLNAHSNCQDYVPSLFPASHLIGLDEYLKS